MRAPAAMLSIALLIAGAGAAVAASTEADFKTAFAAAEAAQKEAGALRNQWTTTVTALAVAKKAAAEGDFEQAVASAKQAEALAKASIFQSRHEQDAWKDLEIR